MMEALDLLREATRGTEYENRLYLVGGILRDRLLGLPHGEDIDLVLEGDAVALAADLHRRGLSQHHPVTYPRFGTAMVTIRGVQVELVTARAESYDTYSRKPEVRAASLRDDAFRRDFTINTLMENLHSGELLDQTGRALADLRNRTIRTPLEPRVTFFDDPLRMLRAVRFAVRLGFTIEQGTSEAIQAESARIDIVGSEPHVVSAERIRDEFTKIMMGTDPAGGLELLRSSGLLERFFPELLEMVGVTQNDWHIYNVWDHTMAALRALHSDAPLEVRLGVLLHDVAKPRTRSEDERGVHFYEHQFVGAEMTRRALNRLRFTGDQVRDVTALVSLHMRLGEAKPDWSDAAVKRLIRAIDPYTDSLFAISAADKAAMRQDVPHTDLEALRRRMEELNRVSNIAALRSPLDGVEIMEILCVRPGPILREAKEFLTNEVIEGRLEENDKNSAAALLRQWHQEKQQVKEGAVAG
jgi:poly(A) polymerase